MFMGLHLDITYRALNFLGAKVTCMNKDLARVFAFMFVSRT